MQNHDRFLKASIAGLFAVAVAACGGGGGGTTGSNTGSSSGGTSSGGVIPASSSATSSGAVGVFMSNGNRMLTSPPSITSTAATPGAVSLVTLPKTPDAAVAIINIATTLGVRIHGTAVDPANDIGVAFNYGLGKVSLFQLSTTKEIATYDTLAANTLSFSGGTAKIVGVIMNPANKTMILATGDGLQVVSYATPTVPTLLRSVPSLAVDATTGVEIMENIAFDASLPVGAMIITGGHDPAMVLVDANTGTAYRPDAATKALFTINQYIDAAAVDTNYHIAVLPDEGTGTTFVDLTKLTLDATAKTYSLPATAVSRITTYYKMDNLALESTNHLILMGAGCGGSTAVVAQLKNPTAGLGFAREAVLHMPTGNDNLGVSTSFYNTCDPHSAGAYLDTTAATPASKALWLSIDGHVADINLLNVLDGILTGILYDPMATNPKDIAYYKIP